MNKLFYLLFILISVGCSAPQTQKTVKASTVHYAKNFQLIPHKDYLELVILNPKTHQVESKFGLVKRDKKVSLPSDLDRIDVPVKNIGAYSTNFVGMISELGETQSIKATTSEQYIYNKELLKAIHTGKVLTSDFDGSNSPSALLMKKVEVLVYSGFGQPFPNQDKLKQLEVLCIANYDWEETHPLGKAEWIKFFGALFDKSEQADRFFDQVKTDYLSLKKQIAKKSSNEKVIFGGMVGDTWFASAGKSYLAGIMKDAGMNYVYKNSDGTASNSYSLSQIMRDESECTRWVNAEAKNMESLIKLNPKFSTFNTVRLNQVYSYFNNQNYFWEWNSMRPDWLLEDFAMISGTIPMKKMHFYERLK